MKLKQTLLAATLLASLPAAAAVVYYDNSETNWQTPHIHYWNGSNPSSWPGTAMQNAGIADAPNLWKYDVGNNTGCLFNAGDGDPSKTGDFTVADNTVYNHSGSIANLNAYLAQLQGGGDTPENGQYTVWFDNIYNCNNIHAYVWDKSDGDHVYSATWPGTEMTYDAAKHLYKFSFTCTRSNPDLYVIIDSTEAGCAHQTGNLKLLNNFVYTHDGAQASVDDYVRSNPAAPLGAVTDWVNDGTVVTLSCEKGSLAITPWAPWIVKVFTLPQNPSVAEERRSISIPSSPEADFSVSETDDAILIAISGGLTVSVDKSSSLVTFLDAKGTILAESKGLQNEGSTRKVSFLPAGDSAFYGGGYNGGWTNWNGHTMTMNNTQTGNWVAGTNPPHCITIPFFISDGGYGVYFDDHYRGATLSPSVNGTSYSTGSQNPIAYYFVGGENRDMEQVMANYTLLTGRQEMPAYWGLGYITSRYGYHNRAEGEQVVNNIKAMPLPLDAIVFDLYWQGDDEYHLGTLNWGSNFPNPKDMMKGFLDKNVHTICITEPYFTHLCPNYNTLRDRGYFADESVNDMDWLHSNQVGLIDSSNPDAMNWMAQFYKQRTHEGIDGWWMDLGEPERHDYDSHHMGGSVDQVHNEFSLLWQKAIHEQMRAEFPDRRLLFMPRSGTAGMQHYAAFPWTGDIRRSWDGLEAQVPALVNSSMSGIGYMGSDVGGFIASSTDANLYLRWIEFAVFSPAMRTHSQNDPEPYLGHYTSVADGIKKFVNLRYQYLPYLYNLAYSNTYQGLPLARPANFHDEDRSTLANCKDAYLWGRDIFVAPVLNNTNSRMITFPDGDWIDMNDWKTRYAGGQTVTYNAKLEVLPHFARVGSFIPRYTQSVFTSTAEASKSDFTIDYILDPLNPTATGFLYEDDHEDPMPVEHDNYILTEFSSELDSDGGLAIVVRRSGTVHNDAPEAHNYTLIVHNYEMPYEGAVYGGPGNVARPARAAALSEEGDTEDYKFNTASSAEELQASDGNGYYYDPDNKKLHIRFQAAPTDGFVLAANNNGVLTGLESVTGEGLITLGYADGELLYSIPAGFKEAEVAISNVAGAEIARVADLNCDGYRNSRALDLPAGIYLAKVKARNAANLPAARSFKFIVK